MNWYQIWTTIAGPASPVHQPMKFVDLETCGSNTIEVEVASTGNAYLSSFSSPHFFGAFGLGRIQSFGATTSLPFPILMTTSFTATKITDCSALMESETLPSYRTPLSIPSAGVALGAGEGVQLLTLRRFTSC